ncbi:MAG: type II toxin-antitoxin system MqsA family antitoxin [Dehalococcoidia bacterium]
MGSQLQVPEEAVNCVICKHGTLVSGAATVMLERDATTLVVKGVPALVCTVCGEEYVDEAVSERLLQTADEAAVAGVQVQVRTYAA